MTDLFKALLISHDGQIQSCAIGKVGFGDLPPGDVVVRVEASTLNYKDGLLLTGAIPLIQSYPMVPGIDLAGIVEQSDDPRWKPGDAVLANGWGLGERHWGGFAQYARLNGDWLIARPTAFSSRRAMALGTAGYTAMLCVLALEKQGVRPRDGDILVTGASGGMGSVAITLLARRGYRVVASTGRPEESDYLRGLGASDIIDRASLAEPGAPLQPERWAGAVDAAGSHTLANICASLRYGGTVAATGIAQGVDFPGTMYPLALRGITICGIDSVMAPMSLRQRAWSCLAEEIDSSKLDALTRIVSLEQAIELAPAILAGKVRGRTVIDIEGA